MAVEKKQILTICTGNVCRSPMAEKLLQHALRAEAAPLNELTVRSAGVAAGYGEAASRNSVEALKRVDISLNDHQSQPLTDELLKDTFLVLGMTESHLQVLQHYFPNYQGRFALFREFMPPEASPQIPDPFGQSLPAYKECMDSMVEAIPSILAYLKKEYKGASQ